MKKQRDIAVRPSIVYMVTNTVNGKRYIGVTQYEEPQRRMTQHFSAASKSVNNGMFYRAIRKYGRQVFCATVLGRYATGQEGREAEMQFIASMRPEYNSTAGGDGMTGYKFPESALKKMSAAATGKPGYWKGKKVPAHVVENLKRIRDARTDKPQVLALGPKSQRLRTVCLNDGVEHASGLAAAKFYGIRASAVSSSCQRKRPTRGGLSFRYWEDRLTPDRVKRNGNSRPVRCVDDGRIFKSLKEAGDCYGITPESIGAVCSGRQYCHTAAGRKFEYADGRNGARQYCFPGKRTEVHKRTARDS